MEKGKSKVIIICGPTASGKSAAAIGLAKKFTGEIISADSRQIFRGMDIGSGKIPRDFSESNNQDTRNKKQSKTYVSEGIHHHLIDVADPMEDFNVSHFKKLAEIAIEKILQRGKVPIVCGGTGFWIQAIVDNPLIPEVAPNEVLRSMLRSKSTKELFSILERKDPERAKNIDSKNPVRLIRALEICEALGKVPSKSSVLLQAYPNGDISHPPRLAEIAARRCEAGQSSDKYDFLQIGISVPREILNEKIKKRLNDRFDEGMIEEVQDLHKNGVTWEWMERIGLEYRWISRYLQEKVSLEEMREKLYFDIIHYAKRQMTWFKRDKRILWVKDYEEAEKTAKKFLGK